MDLLNSSVFRKSVIFVFFVYFVYFVFQFPVTLIE